MSVESRLRRLEEWRQDEAPEVDYCDLLIAQLADVFEQIKDEDFTPEWLAKQPVIALFALGVHRPPPWPDGLEQLLRIAARRADSDPITGLLLKLADLHASASA